MSPYYFLNETLDKLFREARFIIIDMNGLIVDDEALQLQAVNEILRSFL